MCGIAGYLGRQELSPSLIEKTLLLMSRRGPDNQHWANYKDENSKNLYLLHSRLNIIDLDPRANQPFIYKDKTIVFNGEIYNYLEVKEKLLTLGHQFYTRSDTEVLIHALDEWGWDALNLMEGMWSFAMYDKSNTTLTLCRDPFGEKPLYFYRHNENEIFFGSEVKFIASLAQRKFTINEDHVCRFLVNGYKSLYKQSVSFFKEIHELSAGSILQFKGNLIEKNWKYWVPQIQEQPDMTVSEAVAGVRDSLINSVKLRLNSDIPIAFCMSGGVDSNSLISIAKRLFDYDVHGFTIVNTDKRYEEQDMIDIGVQELQIKHSAFPVESDNFLDRMRTLIRYHDAPVYTITYYLNWLLLEQIYKTGYRISISGIAADELLSGYFDHHLFYMNDIKDDAKHLNLSIEKWKQHISPIVRNPYLQDPHQFITNPFQRDHIYLNNDKYSSYLIKPWSEPFSEVYFRKGILQNRMMNELFYETTPVSLHEDDLNSMYYSIENRTPFLDRKLFNFVHSIPAKHLVRDGAAKAVLRDAMKGIVPDPILTNRRKVGFNAPIKDLLKFKEKAVREYLLDDGPIFEILKKEPIEDLIAHSSHANSDSKFLFSFLSSKIFLEEFA